MTITIPCRAAPSASVVVSAAGDRHVNVIAERALLDRVCALCSVFLTWRDGHRDNAPSVHALFDAMPSGAEAVTYTSRFEPDRTLVLNHTARAVYIPDAPDEWRALQTLRTVRNILRWQAFAAGDLFLHAGMVSLGGRGVVFVGGKKAGKTSSLLSLLLRPETALISNDDLTVRDFGAARAGQGWPRSMAIRADTLRALSHVTPTLGRLLARAKHPTNAVSGDHNRGREEPISVWTYPFELAEAIGCGLAAEGRVDAVVFPSFSEQRQSPTLVSLTSAEALRRLRDNRLNHADEFDLFLRDWYGSDSVEAASHIMVTLSETVRCYELVQSLDTLLDGAALVAHAVTCSTESPACMSI